MIEYAISDPNICNYQDNGGDSALLRTLNMSGEQAASVVSPSPQSLTSEVSPSQHATQTQRQQNSASFKYERHMTVVTEDEDSAMNYSAESDDIVHV